MTDVNRPARRATITITITITISIAVTLLTACGSGGDSPTAIGTTTVASLPESGATTAPTTSMIVSTSAPTTAAATSTIAATTTAPTPDLGDTVEQLLTAGMTDPTVWSDDPLAGQPTAGLVGVRIDGRPDVIVTAGANVDGSAIGPTTEFNTGSLTSSLSRSIAYRLIDDGRLDPTTTVDRWVPTMPNAPQITVQMLFEGLTGWADDDTLVDTYVVPDLEKSWSPDDVIATLSTVPPNGAPGTPGGDINNMVMPYVLEHVTDTPYADLVATYVVEPLDLESTDVDPEAITRPGYLQGTFALQGVATSTSEVPTTAFYTFNRGHDTSNSTLGDLLDLLDVWVDGVLLGTDRAATPKHFPTPASGLTDVVSVPGVGTPVTVYCPCTAGAEGVAGIAVGRRPATVASTTLMLRYPDGIDVVLHFNSNNWRDLDTVQHIADEIHEAAAASIAS